MTNALDMLRPKLESLSEVRSPDQPIDVYFQETEDLLAHVEANGLRSLLVSEGLDENVIPEIASALAAARLAQTEWTLINAREKPTDQQELEVKGYALRARAVKKARFTVRKHKSAQTTISNIVEGEGLADLVQDLDDLAKLIEELREEADNFYSLARFAM